MSVLPKHRLTTAWLPTGGFHKTFIAVTKYNASSYSTMSSFTETVV